MPISPTAGVGPAHTLPRTIARKQPTFFGRARPRHVAAMSHAPIGPKLASAQDPQHRSKSPIKVRRLAYNPPRSRSLSAREANRIRRLSSIARAPCRKGDQFRARRFSNHFLLKSLRSLHPFALSRENAARQSHLLKEKWHGYILRLTVTDRRWSARGSLTNVSSNWRASSSHEFINVLDSRPQEIEEIDVLEFTGFANTQQN
jgi:hypothetical protein